MWPLLALLVLTPAHAADRLEVWTPAEYRSEVRQMAKEASRQLALEDERYRRGRSLHRAGNASMATGFAFLVGGTAVTLGRCGLFDPCTGADAIAGHSLTVAGLGLFLAGPAMSSIGSLRTARALRLRGVDVDMTAGIVGVGLIGASVAVPLVLAGVAASLQDEDARYALIGTGTPLLVWLPVASVVAARVQMVRPNRRALPGVQRVVVAPTTTRHGPGVAVHAVF